MKTLPVALQVYSVRDFAEKDFKGTMQAVKDMGYQGVELAGLYDLTKEEVKSILDEVGLVCVSAHVPLVEMMADIEAVLDTYTYLGCKYIAIPYIDEDKRPNTPGFEPALKEFDRIGAACRARGVTLLYHNHDFEYVKVANGQFGLDYMYSTISPDHLQTELDLCWVKVAGQSPVEYLKKYAGRAPVVHLKDYFKEGEVGKMYELIGIDSEEEEVKPEGHFEFRPIGCGMQYFPPILETCVEIGAEWVVVEQDESVARTSMEAIEISRKYLKGLGW